MQITVLKLGGELLEGSEAILSAARAVAALAAIDPVVVVHGGGRAIDAELRARGVVPRFVDGVRITDACALDAVVSVLAGKNNTSLVAAIDAFGGRAVGLTGADAGIGRCRRAAAFRAVDGGRVDLGLVGQPEGSDVALLGHLLSAGYIPVVASIGLASDGLLLNVNADTFAAHLAAGLGARRLIIAGGTEGVLDQDGHPIAQLDARGIEQMTASGAAHSGMVAKLAACTQALQAGVREISIVGGRGVHDYASAAGTRIMAAAAA